MIDATALAVPPGKKRGRRRTFEDVDVFQQLSQILLDGGMSSFSLPRLAERIPCTHQSLSERFGSRAGLLKAYSHWFTSIYWERSEEVRRTTPSPIAQFRQLLLMPIDARIVGPGRPQSPGLWVTLTLEMRRDPVLLDTVAHGQTNLAPMFIEVIKEGQRLGELRAGDPALIVEALLTSTTGAAVLWLLNPVGDPITNMERCFEGTLTRFRL